MIMENAIVSIDPMRVSEFVDFVNKSKLAILAGGCHSLWVGTCVENSTDVLLLAEWNTVGDHEAFLATPGGIAFGQKVGTFLTKAPSVFHYTKK